MVRGGHAPTVVRPEDGQGGASPDRRRGCRHGVRRSSFLSAHRSRHSEDRRDDGRSRRYHPGTRQRPRFGGKLWVGQYLDRRIYAIGPETGTISKTIESDRFVTGVTWVDGDLWHATWENDESELRRVEPDTGAVLERVQMPPSVGVSGLESDGGQTFYCGGGKSGNVRAVRRPRRDRGKLGKTGRRRNGRALSA
jgi:hypothetical protein